MFFMIMSLVLMIVVILIASQIFSNALEYVGHQLGVSSGVTGSIFAAVATALPETMVPILAVIVGTANAQVNEEVSVGAILGAPLMLSTLSIFIMAFSVLKKRGIQGRVMPEKTGYVRDINFFLIAFSLAAVAMFVPHVVRIGLSICLVSLYIIYLYITLKASKKLVNEGHEMILTEPLILTKTGLQLSTFLVVLQLVVGLFLLLVGAKGFIDSVEQVSEAIGISALLLSLLIIPLATELPEKVNSVLWIRKNKDTLAVGNITGAMVFQGTLLPALGILLTPWQPTKIVLTGVLITLAASVWLRVNANVSGVKIGAFFVNGGLYLLYLLLMLPFV